MLTAPGRLQGERGGSAVPIALLSIGSFRSDGLQDGTLQRNLSLTATSNTEMSDEAHPNRWQN
jgi:hypothetical protein